MRLRNVKIENYRSLRNIEMNNIGDLVILVGKNSSGKTNLLEALWLYSKDFSLTPETIAINAPLRANELLWYEGNTDLPIIFTIGIELNERESQRVFPADFYRTFNTDGKFSIIVERGILATPPNMSWKTRSLKCNNVLFIENGQIISPKKAELTMSSKTKSQPLEDSTQSKRSKSRRLAPELAKESAKRTMKEIETLDNLGLGAVQKIVADLQSEITGKIRLIQACRNKESAPSNYAVRTAIVSDTRSSSIISMGENLSSRVRGRWRRLQEDFENFSPYDQRLNVVKSQIIVDEAELSVPLSLVGGGTQEIVTMISHIRENAMPILLIEEPENHLHPELAKKFLKYLRKLSRNAQIWISTQCPFFLNRNEIDNTWTVRRENNETKILRLMGQAELKRVILEIGVKPSDLLFADAILLVEGPTEEDVVPIWARTLGIHLDELGVSILPIRGAEKGKYHLKMWKEITKSAEIPLFILLDAHAHDEAQELITQGLIERDRCVVSRASSIETNYPKKHVLKAVEEEWGIKITASELKNTGAQTIKNALEEKGMELKSNWWKPILGKRVAKMMKRQDIPDETRTLIERIKLVLA